MWKDMLKGFLRNVAEEVKDAYEDVKDEVKDANIGEKLKKVGEELKAEFMSENEKSDTTQPTAGAVTGSAINTTPVQTASQPIKADVPAVLESADAECALTVPADDGERGEFTCLNEKTYSYLIPKDAGFVDEGDSGAAEIHQAYGYGKMMNYEYDAMICFSIAPEFDCEIKESRAKAAYSRYDSAPTRSKLMEIEHPLFTHAYLFDTPKKYRITYLKQLGEYELLGCELILRKSGGDDAWKAKMIEEFKRFAGSCREV